jgi:hypothetical protein
VNNLAIRRAVYWTPRVVSVAFIGFLSLFALDVFQGGRGVWQTVVALGIHLIPSAVLAVAVILAWRWEWIGAALFGAAGAFYIAWVAGNARLAVATKFIWCATIAGPALIIAALYLASWLHHDELRSRPHSA